MRNNEIWIVFYHAILSTGASPSAAATAADLALCEYLDRFNDS